MNIDTSIFKAYDIRGIYPKNLNEEIAENIGRAFSKILQNEIKNKKLNIVVGCDMRNSSLPLKERLILGLTKAGVNVVDVGLVTTPTFYFSVGYFDYDGGIQVSASHNPKEYNGFKIVKAKAYPMGGDTGIYAIRDMLVNDSYDVLNLQGEVITKENVTNDAVTIQSKGINKDKIKSLKIVVDTGNGMGALDIDAIFRDLHCELIKLNFALDGNFPVHVPDPLKEENLAWVKEEVVRAKADLGIATDGDGDRWFFVA